MTAFKKYSCGGDFYSPGQNLERKAGVRGFDWGASKGVTTSGGLLTLPKVKYDVRFVLLLNFGAFSQQKHVGINEFEEIFCIFIK